MLLLDGLNPNLLARIFSCEILIPRMPVPVLTPYYQDAPCNFVTLPSTGGVQTFTDLTSVVVAFLFRHLASLVDQSWPTPP
jgi:hypothetical protein